MEYSNLDKEKDKLNKGIKEICEKFDVQPQILNPNNLTTLTKIELSKEIRQCVKDAEYFAEQIAIADRATMNEIAMQMDADILPKKS